MELKPTDKEKIVIKCFECKISELFIKKLPLPLDSEGKLDGRYFRIPTICLKKHKYELFLNNKTIGVYDGKKIIINGNQKFSLNIFYAEYFQKLRTAYLNEKNRLVKQAGEYYHLKDSESGLAYLLCEINEKKKFWLPKSVSNFNEKKHELSIKKSFLDKGRIDKYFMTQLDLKKATNPNYIAPEPLIDYSYCIIAPSPYNNIKGYLYYLLHKNSFVWVFDSYLDSYNEKCKDMQPIKAENGKMLYPIAIRGEYLDKVKFMENYHQSDTIPELFFNDKDYGIEKITQMNFKLVGMVSFLNRINKVKYDKKYKKRKEQLRIQNKNAFNVENIKKRLGLEGIESSDKCLLCKVKIQNYTNLFCVNCFIFVEETPELTIPEFEKIKLNKEYLPERLFRDKLEIRFSDTGIYFKNKRIKWYKENKSKKSEETQIETNHAEKEKVVIIS